MQWFGRAYGAPYESDLEHVDAPIGEPCGFCDEPIAADDDGLIFPAFGMGRDRLPYHYECHMRKVVGGLNHQLGRCTCCGGSMPPDPPYLSKREAARVAERHRRDMLRLRRA